MSARPVVFAYVIGHGYGHLIRSAAVLERVAEFADVHLRTNGAAIGIASALTWARSIEEVDLGPGLVQRGPLEGDLVETRARLTRHLDAWEEIVGRESERVRSANAQLVYVDIPPIGFEIAARAGVPSLGLTNFTWSWIYEGLAEEEPWFREPAARMRAAEARATHLLVMELPGGVAHFSSRSIIPPVARQVMRSREDVRSGLPFAKDDPRPIVTVSFGGYGALLDLVDAAAKNPDFRFVLVEPSDRPRPENVCIVLRRPDLPHHELIAASDCVVSKLGYGTFGECLHQPTPIVFVPRRQFREYDVLKETTERWLPNALLSEADFMAGKWSDAIRKAMASRPPEPAPRADGAEVAARHIRGMLVV